MFCTNCGAQIEGSAPIKNCPYCNSEIVRTPPQAEAQEPAPQAAPVEAQAPQAAPVEAQTPIQPQAEPVAPAGYDAPVQIPGNFQADPNYVPPVSKPIPAKSNPLLGIVGAILFGLIACVVWVLIGMLGYITYIGGLVMGFCVVSGYRVLGKKFDIYGIICSIIVIILAVLASNIFIYTWQVFSEPGMEEALQFIGFNGFGDVFFRFFEFGDRVDTLLGLTGSDSIMGEFTTNLVISYVFSAIGYLVCAIPTFKTRNQA
ncbi:MAG: hypothetical protein J1E39_04110 [Eubacterium sp.]|nr:hypothetical protein [Eubacterium sp.]